MDDPWTTRGRHVDDPWTTHGHPWTPMDACMDDPWTTRGRPMDDPWTTRGRPMDAIKKERLTIDWTRRTVDDTWTTWTTHGLDWTPVVHGQGAALCHVHDSRITRVDGSRQSADIPTLVSLEFEETRNPTQILRGPCSPFCCHICGRHNHRAWTH